MRNKNSEQAKYLFRAIGEIDDRLVHEAATYRPASRSAFSRVMLIAACLTLALLLSAGAFLISLRNVKFEHADDADNSFNAEGQEVHDLDTVLLSGRDTANYTTLSSAENLDFFSGKATVVWQYADSDELCVSRTLSQDEVKILTSQIDRGNSVGDTSPALSCRVWILMGDGTVISPYLKSSSGNVGTATLFDYNAELIPSQSFTSCISEILN